MFPLLRFHGHQDRLRCSHGFVWMLKEPPECLGAAGGIEPGPWPERLTGKPVHEALFSDNHWIIPVISSHCLRALRCLHSLQFAFCYNFSHSLTPVPAPLSWWPFLCHISLSTDWHFIIRPSIWKRILLCRFSLHPTTVTV